ncbi:MAG: hypothetical protein ACJA0G_001576 [Kangiellaceae bacterium]|jgi:uncharacterized protein (TIGR02285 family)
MTIQKLMFSTKFIVIVIFTLSNDAAALQPGKSEQTTIYYDYIPFTKAYGTQQPKSAVSAANLLLLNNISEKVDVQFLPTIRLLSELEQDTQMSVCSLFKIKTDERSQSHYFSLPISFLSTNRLYLRRGIAPLSSSLLNAEGELKSLSSLFIGNDKVIMLWDFISYGNLIDQAIKTIPSNNKIVIQGLTSHSSLAKMIERGRTDYAVMFPSEIVEFENNAQPLDLLSYRIEGVKPISTGHLMCKKNEASKAFLKMANNKLLELYKSPSFIEANTLNVTQQERALVINEIKRVTSTVSGL